MTVTDDWNTPNGTPNGGYVLARGAARRRPGVTAARSARRCRSRYFRPPAPGDATIDVTALRIGKRVATFEAVLSQDDKPVVHAVASFHDADSRRRPPAPGTSRRRIRRRTTASTSWPPCRPARADPRSLRLSPRERAGLDGGQAVRRHVGDVLGAAQGRPAHRRHRRGGARGRLSPGDRRDRSPEVGDRPADGPLPAPSGHRVGARARRHAARSSTGSTTRTSSCGTRTAGCSPRAVSWPSCAETRLRAGRRTAPWPPSRRPPW